MGETISGAQGTWYVSRASYGKPAVERSHGASSLLYYVQNRYRMHRYRARNERETTYLRGGSSYSENAHCK